jgi:hypothetical protein
MKISEKTERSGSDGPGHGTPCPYRAPAKNPGYCVARSSKMLIYHNKLRFSRFGDALSAGFLEVPYNYKM